MASSIPSPILIFGDIYTSKNNILAAKKKYPNLKWVTKSATKDSLNNIRMEVGVASWDDTEKVILVQELPNKKNIREFLLDLAQSCPPSSKLLIWDSTNQIKVDTKTQSIEKTWSDFVSGIKAIPNSKVINNGEQLNEKDSEDSINFIVKKFADKAKVINVREAKLLLSIVGYDRGMLDSDIKKMSLIAPDTITPQFILDNAFPTTKESVLYKMANAMDAGSYEDCIDIVERFLASGTNHNLIAEIIVKKARWQLATAYLWASGLSWEYIPEKLMEMGKFPSSIWHDFQIDTRDKKLKSESLQSPQGILDFMTDQQGIPDRILKLRVGEDKEKESKGKMTRKGAEVIPMYFMASQTVDFVRNRIVNPNNTIPMAELRGKVLNRAIRIYLFVQEKLSEIRFGDNPDQDLQEMIAAIMSPKV